MLNYIPHPLYPVHAMLGLNPRAEHASQELRQLRYRSTTCSQALPTHHSVLRGSLLTIPQTPREPHGDTGWLGKGTSCCLPCAMLASHLGGNLPAPLMPSEDCRLCQHSSAQAKPRHATQDPPETGRGQKEWSLPCLHNSQKRSRLFLS